MLSHAHMPIHLALSEGHLFCCYFPNISKGSGSDVIWDNRFLLVYAALHSATWTEQKWKGQGQCQSVLYPVLSCHWPTHDPIEFQPWATHTQMHVYAHSITLFVQKLHFPLASYTLIAWREFQKRLNQKWFPTSERGLVLHLKCKL